ncbi:MAG: hypothetical protein V1905_00930 [bacterium]
MIAEQDEGSATVAEMVATPGVSYLLLRSLEGVGLVKSRAEADEWVRGLEKELFERLDKLATASKDQIEYFAKRRLATTALLKQISAKYHLAVYTSSDGIIFTKTTL